MILIIRLIFLIFIWLLIRRLWRSYVVARTGSNSRRRPYPGRKKSGKESKDLGDITQQEISDAEFEELDDR